LEKEMANVISLKNCKRFERHRSSLDMRVLKASVETMRLADQPRDANSGEIIQEKSLTPERQ